MEPGTMAATCFGISTIDNALPAQGLPHGEIHEWSFANPLLPSSSKNWHPPITVVTSLIRNALLYQHNDNTPAQHTPFTVVWIGRRCFPMPMLLEEVFSFSHIPQLNWRWQEHCFFLDPETKRERLWALLETLRSPHVSIVVADASHLKMIDSRKALFAARRGSTLGLLMRPCWEIEGASAAATRWKLSPALSSTASPAWQLELLRARGLPAKLSWRIEWNNSEHTTNPLRLSSELVGGPDTTETQKERKCAGISRFWSISAKIGNPSATGT